MNATSFIKFWIEKMKDTNLITNDLFENIILKNNDMLNFLYSSLNNINKKTKFNSTFKFNFKTNGIFSPPQKRTFIESFSETTNSQLQPTTTIKTSSIKHTLSPHDFITCSSATTNSHSSTKKTTSTRHTPSPHCSSANRPSLCYHPSNNFSVVNFSLTNEDQELDIKKLSIKYKLDYIDAVKIILNKKMLKLQDKQITNFKNCYFKVDKHSKNYYGSCRWTMLPGWAGSHSHNISLIPSENSFLPKKIPRLRRDEFPNSFPLVIRQYKSKCLSNYIRFDYIFLNTILVHFIGAPNDSCRCYSIETQKKIVAENKDMKNVEIYHQFHQHFKSKHTVSNIRNLLNRKSLLRRQFKNQNPVDHIQSLLKFASQERSFVQCQNRVQGDLPSFILADPSSYYDMLSHIIKGNFYIHIDKTFNICNYHVTAISYLNTKLIDTRSNCFPLFLGPIFIHKKSTKQNFNFFLTELKTQLTLVAQKLNYSDEWLSKIVFVSDQEQAITSQIMSIFPKGTLILCSLHISKNIFRKLDSRLLSQSIVKLLYCDSEANFESLKKNILQSNIYTRTKYKKYIQNQMDLIYNFVLIPKWKLNLPNKKPFTNNPAESANAKIKSITGTYTLKPLEVVKKIKKLIDIQIIDTKKSFENEGQFRIPNNTAPKFKLTDTQKNTLFYHFISTHNNSYTISTCRKTKTFKAAWKKHLVYINGRPYIQSTDKKISFPAFLLNTARKPGQKTKKTTNVLKF